MAQKKAGGSTRNGRDSKSKRLGLKITNNNFIKKGSLIIKQNGAKFFCGKNTFYSKNYSIHSLINGIVIFYKKNNKIYIKIKNVY